MEYGQNKLSLIFSPARYPDFKNIGKQKLFDGNGIIDEQIEKTGAAFLCISRYFLIISNINEIRTLLYLIQPHQHAPSDLLLIMLRLHQ